jgi:hypothetical protein
MRKYLSIILLLVIYSSIGAFFGGEQFLSNISSSVPKNASTNILKPQFMLKGDHFEQLYRYSLPRHNLKNGRPLYESAYQYNFVSGGKPFTEGWVFFPFSLLHLVLAIPFGDIASYNLIALMSFPMVGMAMFLLVFFLTRSYPAALLSSLVLALLPHRTSFLFGEMVFGVDLMWPPLILLFFEKSLRTNAIHHFLLFAVFLFFYTTSNFQGFFLFALFSLPYFMGRSIRTFRKQDFSSSRKIKTAAFLSVSLLPSFLYLLYIKNLIGESGLLNGQRYEAVERFSPQFFNLFQVWSGNEKTVYLGWPMLGVVILIIVLILIWHFKSKNDQIFIDAIDILVLSGVVFFISYLFCFGSNLDSKLNLNIYRFFFDHVPGANCIRTPGRLMGTTGFYFSLCFGYIVYLAIVSWTPKNSNYPFLVWLITALAALGIIFDYKYTRPLMVKLETKNEAYEKIRGAEGIVFTIPTQMAASDGRNATFLYYAQKYDLRLFTGHSSMYPKEWNNIIRDFLPINNGKFDRKMMELFRERGITHLVAHATNFEPNVPLFVVERLKQSPYLNFIAEANGVYVFKININAKGEQIFDIGRLISNDDRILQEFNKFHFLDGWYPRETYPNQRPFRWMHGTNASGIIFSGNAAPRSVEFEYRCPNQRPLKTTINGIGVETEPVDLSFGWKRQSIDLSKYGTRSFYVEFSTPQIYQSPRDVREFGCMVGDIFVR